MVHRDRDRYTVVPKVHKVPKARGMRDRVPTPVPVGYRTKKQAKNVSRKVKNSTVVKADKGCLSVLVLLAGSAAVLGFTITEVIRSVV